MDIFKPPDGYIEYRIATYELDGPELVEAQKKFYSSEKNKFFRPAIKKFFNELHEARNNMSLPVELVIRKNNANEEAKGPQPMMIYDIFYFMENDKIKIKKQYIPLLNTKKSKVITFVEAKEEDIPF